MNRFVSARIAPDGVNGRTKTPPLGQPGNMARSERTLQAQSLKMKTHGNTASANIEHAPAYSSEQFNEHNRISNNQYQQGGYAQETDETQRQTQYQRDVLEDTTVASDFDRTKSDIGFVEPEHDYYVEDDDAGYGDQNQGYREQDHVHHNHRPHVERAATKETHVLQYKQSRSPLVATKVEPSQRQQHFSLAGRFEGKKHQDLQIRNGNDQVSRKRSRSGDMHRAPVSRGLELDSPGEEDDIDDIGPNGLQDVTVRLDNILPSSDTEEAAGPVRRTPRMPPQHQNSQNMPDPGRNQAEGKVADDRLLPDYSTEELKQMKYSDLESENWDMVPHAEPFELPNELQGRKVTLEKKIAYHIKLEEDDQLPFYESLTTDEWEQAGDLFIEKFGDLMKKLKAKKREKRVAAERFENEIKEREAHVRNEAGKIDKALEGMEATGKSLLQTPVKRGRR
ncbi:hypothetical protein VTL71DRAFT_7167 [Oculimacula yallundae]|uniref:Extracellular mutant protein 11 C-terminal domain-containing protein n=1 Tax=Oculimacula yallundae TaxID=86028 RepID=A0ABR4BXL0_9HELO